MINLKKLKQLFLILCVALFVMPVAHALPFFDDDADLIWQSGLNRYIKYVAREQSAEGANDHPVRLKSSDVKNALLAVEIPDDSLLTGIDTTKRVFNFAQIKLLSEQLPKALKNARPDQDIIFVLEKNESGFLGSQDQRYLAGRLFYKARSLNIIFGEYDFFRSQAFESVYDPSGRGAVPYNFFTGSRNRSSRVFQKQPLVKAVGVENKILKKGARYDWLVVDVNIAAKGYLANDKQNQIETAQDRRLKAETAKMAKQQRQMRAEMARLRKEVQQGDGAGTSAKSLEARMRTLQKLKTKKLITEAEYQRKRQQILDDI